MMKIALITILTLSSVAFGQSNPVLVDESDRVPCDHFLAKLDGFLHQLSANPHTTGQIVVFGQNDDMRANVFYEEMMRSYFKQRKFDLGQVHFVRSSFRSKLAFEFWLVPSGAVFPDMPRIEWSYKFSPNEKPYKFTWEDNYDDICPEVDGVKLYIDFLRANPTSRGNIVIRQRTLRRLYQKTKQVILDLTKTYGISRSRLRIFQVRETPDGINQSVEYWLVP